MLPPHHTPSAGPPRGTRQCTCLSGCPYKPTGFTSVTEKHLIGASIVMSTVLCRESTAHKPNFQNRGAEQHSHVEEPLLIVPFQDDLGVAFEDIILMVALQV